MENMQTDVRVFMVNQVHDLVNQLVLYSSLA